MQIPAKWVAERIGVSSRGRTKIFSLVFVSVIISASALVVSSSGKTVASDITVEKVIELTNASRAEAGESALTVNSKLSQAAETKASDMVANNYFSHTSPAGATPWSWIQKENYDYIYAGENLAMDFHAAENMEEAWMASPTHRANILNQNYHEMGTAVKEGIINGHDTILVVVMFGSGDKNSSSLNDVNKKTLNPEKRVDSGKNFPTLSVGEEGRSQSLFEQPTITSPQSGEIFSGSEVKITGRAKPEETVAIFDNGNFVGSAVADPDGWFSFSETGLAEGTHGLALQNKNVFADATTNFFVDREKPNVDFRLYADQNDPSRFFLEASADKNNCTFQFNGESRPVLGEDKALFSVDAEKSSIILRVSDQAGNKNFRQINLANYYPGSGNSGNNISDKLAALMSAPENIFANDPGRDAMKNNLGLAMGGINNY
ncbi:MAG: CAP domain-containing protein [Candidatus Moranbacteria bacterium]|nr:CAP domain-containing protein [Candidatus Moranbacteria bacterium]